MPAPDFFAKTACFRFIMRATVSCKFRADFEGADGKLFDDSYPRYYGRGPMGEPHRKLLREIMTCDQCNAGMRHVHGHLHAHNIMTDGCENDHGFKTPYLFWLAATLAVLVTAAGGMTLNDAWGREGATMALAAGWIGVIAGPIQLFFSRYAKL